jgi:type IV pilus assembly protein PilQ
MKVQRRLGFPAVVLALAAALLVGGNLAYAEDVAAADPNPPAVNNSPARLGTVRTRIGPEATTLTLEISGEFTYFSSAPGERLVFVDLPQVLSTQSSNSHLLQSGLVSSYRVVPYVQGERACARLEVLLKEPSAVSYQQLPGALQVRFTPSRGRVPPAVAAAAPASPAAPAERMLPRGTAIERVTFARQAGSTVVRIEANGPVECHAFALPNPRRLVLDIPRTENRVGSRPIPVGLPPVKNVRAGQFSREPLVSRVVMELDDASPYNVQVRGNVLEVEWKGEPAEAPLAAPAGPVLEPRPPAVAADKREEPPVPEILLADSFLAPLQMPEPPLPDLVLEPPAARNAPKAEIAVQTEKPEPAPAAPAPPPPAAAVTTEAEAPPLAPPVQPLAPPATPAPSQAQGQAPPAAPQAPPAAPPTAPAPQAAPQPAPSPAAAPTSKYTGEPISVNLKDVDLKDFFRLVHEVSGLNIVLDPTVAGKVTLVMEDVPWDQVLDIVLRNNGLDKQLEGNVLRIAKRDTLKAEEESRMQLEQARQAGVERVTVMRPLSYARATQMMTTLMKFRSPRGEMVADDRTNTLIITDIPQAIPTIDDILKQLDRRTVQVEIEARVVSATRDFARDVGTQFGFGTSATGGRSIFGGNIQSSGTSPVNPASGLPPTQPFTSGAPSATPALLPNLPLFSNFPVAATSGLAFAHRSPNFAVDLVISLAESKGLAKTLSRPRIITQNNVQGSVMQGVQVPVQTTINNTVSAQMVNATLTLTVRPQVTNEGSIFLEITVENNSLGGFSPPPFSQPLINTQKATTSVLVNDGDTIVFGGVVTNSNSTSTSQVPLLGSVPVLGHIFKNNRLTTDTRELLFFITPKIV